MADETTRQGREPLTAEPLNVEPLSVVAVSAGLSEDSTTTRLTERMLAAAEEGLRERGIPSERTHITLRELARPLADQTVTGMPTPDLDAAFEAVRRADAVITVAPVYKQVPVGIHTLFWQLLEDESLAGTPVLLGATGGTPRHSLALEQMRPLIGYLKGVTTATSVFAATDDWGDAEGGRALRGRIAQATGELVDLTVALRGVAGAGSDAAGGDVPRAAEARSARMRDEFDPDQVTPFADLLGR